MFVVDANVGITTTDEQLLKVLRKARVPLVLVANKVDDQRGELEGRGAVEPRLRRAVPGPFRPARPRLRRPAGRGGRHAGGGPARRRPRPAARGPRRSLQRREVLAAEPAREGAASSSTTSPAPPATPWTRRSSSAARSGPSWTPPRDPSPHRAVPGRGLLRPLHARGADRAEVAVVLLEANEADLHPGPQDHRHGPGVRARPCARLQQVGPTDGGAAQGAGAEIERTSAMSPGRRA